MFHLVNKKNYTPAEADAVKVKDQSFDFVLRILEDKTAELLSMPSWISDNSQSLGFEWIKDISDVVPTWTKLISQ